MNLRIGQGWDSHRLVEGRKLILGGIEIPSTRGEEAHSDGDVLLHALIDALLGALSLGDIGTHFPPSDKKWKDANSLDLLKHTLDVIKKKGYRIVNVDTTVILETPKLKEWKLRIRESMAAAMSLDLEALSLKAKTAEKLGPIGRSEGIEALAIVLLEKTI